MVVKLQRPDKGFTIALAENISHYDIPATPVGQPTSPLTVHMNNGSCFQVLPAYLQELEDWMVATHTVSTPGSQSLSK